jgi:STE24 endopeptidase
MGIFESFNSCFNFVDKIDKNDLFSGIIVFMTLMFVWEYFLSIRQYLVEKKNTKPPKELLTITDQETFEKSRSYALDKRIYGFFNDMYGQIEGMLILYLGALPYIWSLSKSQLASFDSEWLHSEMTTSLLFVFYFMTFSTITGLPWSIYYTFVIEKKHGFNKQTFGFFVKDNIKKYILTLGLSIPILSLLIYIISIGGDYFFIYAWLFTTCVSMFFIAIYADFIAPLFDSYTPLKDGTLRTQIEELAKSQKFPLYKLYVVEGSKRSVHSNAYMYGFYKSKRIVIFDTLIEGYVSESAQSEATEKEEIQNGIYNEPAKVIVKETTADLTKESTKGCSNEEIVAVLAHELGHWKLNHNLKNLFISQINTFLYFLIFAVLVNRQVFYQAFGFDTEKPILIGLIVIMQFIFAPYNELVSFMMTLLSRRFEFQADAFAKGLNKTQWLKTALVKLQKDNLSFPMSDWLYSTWHFSHPPVLERLAALDDKKQQ